MAQLYASKPEVMVRQPFESKSSAEVSGELAVVAESANVKGA